MLMTSERSPAIRTMRGWAIDVLQNAGAIRECEEHGWMQDRADPHAWERAIDIAREEPRFKYAALARGEDSHGVRERLTPVVGFLLVGVHGFGTRCRVDEPVLHFAGLVCMHQGVE
jgi:hypothetical protein